MKLITITNSVKATLRMRKRKYWTKLKRNKQKAKTFLQRLTDIIIFLLNKTKILINTKQIDKTFTMSMIAK